MNPELRTARLGKLTASMAAVIMGGPKTDGLEKYIRRLAGERLYGDLGEEGYQSEYMKRGNAVENDALDWYEFETESTLERGPHVDHPTIPYVAATPDAVVTVAGKRTRTVEAKSPCFHVWAVTAEDRRVPPVYVWQTKWQLWTLELSECDFVVWHPCPGGIIVPGTVTQSEIDQMAERAALVEARIRQTMEIISERKAA